MDNNKKILVGAGILGALLFLPKGTTQKTKSGGGGAVPYLVSGVGGVDGGSSKKADAVASSPTGAFSPPDINIYESADLGAYSSPVSSGSPSYKTSTKKASAITPIYDNSGKLTGSTNIFSGKSTPATEFEKAVGVPQLESPAMKKQPSKPRAPIWSIITKPIWSWF